MTVGKNLPISIFVGWIIAAALIFIALSTEVKIARIALWNVVLTDALVGNGPLAGYNDAQGHPVYVETLEQVLAGFISPLTGFLIYPAVVFLSLTIIDKFRLRKNYT